MIEAHELTKKFGSKTAVDDISFSVHPGMVTGFLGPNGSGKSTTMRLIAGLDHPTSGSVTVEGRRYRDLVSPISTLGALLESRTVHPGRSARNHLRALAATSGISRRRVTEVIEMTGIGDVAGNRVGGFSLGMGQRLGIASAMLGDPRVLMLDEPVNGLDPEGVQWVRRMCRAMADQGRTVFVSSHLMSEMSLMADHLLVIGRGRIITEGPVDDVIDSVARPHVTIASPQIANLVNLLQQKAGDEFASRQNHKGTVDVQGVSAEEIGDLAAQHGIALHQLTPTRASLEDAFINLTHEHVDYHAQDAHGGAQ